MRIPISSRNIPFFLGVILGIRGHHWGSVGTETGTVFQFHYHLDTKLHTGHPTSDNWTQMWRLTLDRDFFSKDNFSGTRAFPFGVKFKEDSKMIESGRFLKSNTFGPSTLTFLDRSLWLQKCQSEWSKSVRLDGRKIRKSESGRSKRDKVDGPNVIKWTVQEF